MTVLIKRILKTKTISGSEVELNASEPISTDTTVTVVCEGPRCHNGDNDLEKSITWKQESAAESNDAVPDDAFRILTLEDFFGSKHTFCCPRCLADFMLGYKIPLSPREKAKMDADNAAVDARKAAKVVQFPSGEPSEVPAHLQQPSEFHE